jgi:hypothetical protein
MRPRSDITIYKLVIIRIAGYQIPSKIYVGKIYVGKLIERY